MKRPQLLLRDLLWLMLVWALVTGWGLDHWRSSTDYLKEQFEDLTIKHRRLVQRSWVTEGALESLGYRVVDFGDVWRVIPPDDDFDPEEPIDDKSPEP